jgi:hypothetical protein
VPSCLTTTPQKMCTCYATMHRGVGSTLYSDKLLGEGPEKPWWQQLGDDHSNAPMRSSPTPLQFEAVHQAADGGPTWRTTPHYCSTVTYLCIPFLPLSLVSIKGGRGNYSGLDISIPHTHDVRNTLLRDLGLVSLSRPVCTPYYKQSRHKNTAPREWA